MFGRNGKLDTGWLGGVPFFSSFDDKTLANAAALGERVEAEAGGVLMDQGRHGDMCYVIVEGQAVVTMNGEWVATVGPGSMVGEMALVEHRPRTASVIADSEMVLVGFGTKEFRELLDTSPAVREEVLEQLNSRLRANENRQS